MGEVSCRLEERLRQIIANKLIFRGSTLSQTLRSFEANQPLSAYDIEPA